MTAEFEIRNFKVLSTGADGGHYYAYSTIEYLGRERKMTVIFKNKIDEEKIATLDLINVKGQLQDEGIQYPLTLLQSELIKSQNKNDT